MNAIDADLPELALTFGFSPDQGVPGGPNVIVTTDPQYVVANQLYLNIRNPAGYPVINFQNPDGLTPEDPLPPISAPGWPQPLDRLYIRFPWCDQEPAACRGYLTTTSLSTGINVSPAPDAAERWYTRPMSDPTYGLYWIIFPQSADVRLEANESIQFIISNIITYIPWGTLTEIYVKPDVKGYAKTDKAVASLYLINPPPEVAFNASKTVISAGETLNLTWSTLNAKSCTLRPIDGGTVDVPTNEANGYSVRPLANTTFTLEAQSPIGLTTPKSIAITVKNVSIASFGAVPSSGVRLGDAVNLSWQTDSAVRVSISPDIGQVCSNAQGCDSGSTIVRPGKYTNYVLTAFGEAGPISSNVVVFPLPVGWNTFTTAAPWNTRDRPVFMMYQPQGVSQMRFWFLAGGTSDSQNFVYYSEDANTWTPATNQAAFPVRANAGGVVLGGKMWVMGGVDKGGFALNDVWQSTDGIEWTQIQTGDEMWTPRSAFGCIAFAGKMWVIGGFDGSGDPLGDIWNSADGVTWAKVSDSPAWSPRGAFGLAEYSGKLWILGGQTGGSSELSDQIWSSSDGIGWYRQNNGTWSARAWPNVAVIGSTLYLIGGSDGSGKGSNTFYKMNIEGSWTVGLGAPWNNLNHTASLTYQSAIWFAGGQTANESANKAVWLYAPSLATS